jgi:glycosyltransferase involved in cell wall biosynthesis
LLLTKTDVIIFASKFFPQCYEFFNKNKYVIENRPSKNIMDEKPTVYRHDTDRLKISFIGGLRYFDVMKNLILAVKDMSVDLLFFGDGPDHGKLKDFATGYSNVYFWGRYDYGDIGSIYKLSDIIWAVYPNKSSNVKYAISNKFFESIIFSKPAIYADRTFLGEYVAQNKIGFEIDPYNVDKIRKLLSDIKSDRSVCESIVKNIERYRQDNDLYWESYMKDFSSIFNNEK